MMPDRVTAASRVISALRLFASAATGFCSFIFFQPAFADVPDLPELRAIVQAAIDDLSEREGKLLDPRVVEQIDASVAIFAGNFCYPADSSEGMAICDKTVNNQSVMRDMIAGYVRDLASRPKTITTPAERLAAVLGGSMASAGWPSEADNSVAVIDLPESIHGSTVLMQMASGPASLGRAGRTLFTLPGVSTIIIQSVDGSQQQASISVRPNQKVALDLKATQAPSSNFAGRVAAVADDYCYSGKMTPLAPVDKRAKPFWAFNWGRVTFAEPPGVKLDNLATFAKEPYLNISIRNESQATCDENCAIGLGSAFAEAIAVWRAGCERCDPNALSVIGVAGTVWADQRIVSRLHHLQDGKLVPLDLQKKLPDEPQDMVVPPTLSVPTTFVVAYDDIGTDDIAKATICGASSSQAPWIGGAQYLLCGATQPADAGHVDPSLVLEPGDTSCGRAETYVACGTPNAGIELTMQDVEYKLSTRNGTVTLAASPSPFKVDLRGIVLHEVGHWFGVPHSEIAGDQAAHDVMSSVLGGGNLCVSAQSLMMLNNAADLRWDFRVTAGGGLARPGALPTSNR
jgi:hypothetical protein